MTDLLREVYQPVLKLKFTVHGIMESLSEFGLWTQLARISCVSHVNGKSCVCLCSSLTQPSSLSKH
jgi:hypothetical protein